MESGNRGMKAWYAWSRAGSRPPLRGATRPGCPAFGGASCGVLGLGPPCAPAARSAPLGRRPVSAPGLRSRPPGRPLGPLGAGGRCGWLGPPPLPWGRSGGRSACRRAACARRRGPVPPPAGPAAAWPGPAPGGRASPGARPPPRGVWAGVLLSLAAPCRGRCAPAAARPAPLPSSRRVPLPGALSGGPASALGRRASSLRGRLGRLRRPFPRRRPLRWGRSCWCRGGRSPVLWSPLSWSAALPPWWLGPGALPPPEDHRQWSRQAAPGGAGGRP